MELRGVILASNELSYEILWQTHQKEKRSNELQLIPKTFYEDMAAFMNGMDGGAQPGDAMQKENAARLLSGIFEKRKQKILIYAAYGRQLPGPVPQREADLYDEATKLMKADTLAPAKADTAGHKLRSMQTIPEIILPSGGKVGPLEKDQVIEVKEKDDRMFLVNSKICREV